MDVKGLRTPRDCNRGSAWATIAFACEFELGFSRSSSAPRCPRRAFLASSISNRPTRPRPTLPSPMPPNPTHVPTPRPRSRPTPASSPIPSRRKPSRSIETATMSCRSARVQSRRPKPVTWRARPRRVATSELRTSRVCSPVVRAARPNIAAIPTAALSCAMALAGIRGRRAAVEGWRIDADARPTVPAVDVETAMGATVRAPIAIRPTRAAAAGRKTSAAARAIARARIATTPTGAEAGATAPVPTPTRRVAEAVSPMCAAAPPTAAVRTVVMPTAAETSATARARPGRAAEGAFRTSADAWASANQARRAPAPTAAAWDSIAMAARCSPSKGPATRIAPGAPASGRRRARPAETRAARAWRPSGR